MNSQDKSKYFEKNKHTNACSTNKQCLKINFRKGENSKIYNLCYYFMKLYEGEN